VLEICTLYSLSSLPSPYVDPACEFKVTSVVQHQNDTLKPLYVLNLYHTYAVKNSYYCTKSGWPKVVYVFSIGSAEASPYCNPPEWHGYTDYNNRGMCSQWQCNRAVCSCIEGSLAQLQVEDVSSVDMEPSPPPSQSYLVSFMCMWACVYFPKYTFWRPYIFFHTVTWLSALSFSSI